MEMSSMRGACGRLLCGVAAGHYCQQSEAVKSVRIHWCASSRRDGLVVIP